MGGKGTTTETSWGGRSKKTSTDVRMIVPIIGKET